MFEAHAAHVFDYCRSLLADRLDAADAAEATLVTAYSLLDRLQDVGRQRAWLFALARRECVGAHPVRTRLPNSARDPDAVIRAGEANAEDEPETEELRLEIIEGHGQAGATLRALPAREREVLDLVYRHYLSSADVGAVLGVPAERASALLAGAVTSFDHAYGARQVGARQDRAHQDRTDRSEQVTQPEDATGALVTGVRVISTIPLLGLPPAIRARATSIVLDPELASFRQSMASGIGVLGPDGFPLEPPPGAVLHKPAQQQAAYRGPRKRLVVLGALLLAAVTAAAVMASSSSGVPNAITHAIGQALGQDHVGTPRASIRSLTPHLPITALLPKRRDPGLVLPILPASPSGNSRSPKPHPAPSKTTIIPSVSPSPWPSATPTPTPTPSPTPTPTPSPTPTPTDSGTPSTTP
jgi:RNA polymerase sigma factor (sigma-70 family)